jgi:flagellar motor switch/type III secretory pathway protein FliN
MRRFTFAGTSRLNGARAQLPTVINDWAGQWCLNIKSDSLAINIEEAFSIPLQQQPDCWLQLDSKAGSLWLAYDESAARQIIFDDHAALLPKDKAAQKLIEDAQQALLQTILTSLGHTAIGSVSDQQPQTPYQFGSALVVVNIQIRATCFRIFIDAGLLDTYLPARDPGLAKSLVKRQDAIANVKVKLRVSLPLAQLQVNDMYQLNQGDILRCQTLLTQSFQLALDNGPVIARANLGRQQQQVAVQLIDSSKK